MFKRKKNSSIRLNYFGAYLGVVFLACMILGIFLLSRAVKEINTASWNNYQEKMDLIANELQIEQEIFENISYRVKSSAYYRPFFVQRSPYYETTLVDDIAKFKDYSPLINQYYCIQRVTGNVYSASGKLTIPQFERYKLGSSEGFMEELFAAAGSFRILPHPSDKTLLLIILTFRVQTDGVRIVPDTALVFLISRQTLAERLAQISGLDTSQLTVYWNDVCLLDNADVTADAAAMRQNGAYRVYSHANPTSIYKRMIDFEHYFLALLFAVTAVLLLLATFIAHRSYQPVDKIITRLNLPSNGSAADIEAAIQYLQDSNHSTTEQLQASLKDLAHQRRAMANQLIFAKLNGVDDAQLDSFLTEAGITMNHPLFCVILVCFHDGMPRNEVIASVASALSDDTMNLYPAGRYQTKYHIMLINFSEQEQLEEICAMLIESLEAECCSASLIAGSICEEMQYLQHSFTTAIARREMELTPAPAEHDERDTGWYDDRNIRLLMRALYENDPQRAHSCLEESMVQISRQYTSMIFQRCIWTDIGNQLLKTTNNMQIQLDTEEVHILLMSVDASAFQRQFDRIIDLVAAAASERSTQENQQLNSEMVAFIEKNFFSPQFTIAYVAEQFNISERKVGNIVKVATGRSYKEFIIYLRMNRAKMLLNSGNCNVSQASESVGYNNIPYFIKTFRSYTGYTPGEYKKLFSQTKDTPNEHC